MKKSKFVLLGIVMGFLIVSGIYVSTVCFYSDTTLINELYVTSDSELLSFYVESDDGSYVYTESGTFPSSGYKLNSEKSYCVNGSSLSYDSSTAKVSVSAQGADSCYVYFDIVPDVRIYTVNTKIVTTDYTSTDTTVTCDSGTYSWNEIYKSIDIKNFTTETNCTVTYEDSSGTTISDYITNLCKRSIT